MAIRDPERYFDQRTIRRHIKRGHVSDEDYKRFVDSLPDVSENIMDKEEGGDDDGFEERMDDEDDEDGEAAASPEAAGEAVASPEAAGETVAGEAGSVAAPLPGEPSS